MIQRSETKSEPQDETSSASSAAPAIEAMLFVAHDSISLRRFADILEVPAEQVRKDLKALQERYSGPESGVHLVEIAGGWRLLSNPDHADAVAALAGQRAPDRLSPAALETLAIIAYRQPVGRAEVERIRGVGVGPILRHLLELDLIKVAGREEALGRALLYGTTRSFLDRFGLKSVKDLPASLEL
ncbi:MAG: SMC-Scp complex subunit ScpB [Planctomycetota bacterium]|jgi:segregation and condensation protein B